MQQGVSYGSTLPGWYDLKLIHKRISLWAIVSNFIKYKLKYQMVVMELYLLKIQ
jgi:hypothetical protein